MTVVFHGRRDLGTIQTYVARGAHGTGAALSADELLRVPCDLDLGDAEDRDEAERLYAEQARALRDALAAADTVLDIWREPLEDLAHAHVDVDTRIELDVELPAHRLLPTALVAADRQIVVAPVCEARTLAEGRPPLGIACLQQDIARVYPLPDDPEACLEDFLEVAAEHAHRMADALERQRRPSRASSSSRTSTRPADASLAAAWQRRTKVTAIVFGTFLFLGHLAAARAGAGRRRAASARGRSTILQRAGARRRRRGARPRCRAAPRDATCARVTRERTAKLTRPGEVEILNFDPSTQAAFTNQTGTRARRLAHAGRSASRSCSAWSSRARAR